MDEPIPADLLATAAATWPAATALRIGADSWTYAELDYAANEVAGRVPAGERIAFRAAPTAAAVAALWGVPRGGGIAVPIDPNADAATAANRAAAFDATLGWPRSDSLHNEFEPSAERVALIVATSGSSAAPRGSLVTFGNIAAAAKASQLHLGTRQVDSWLLAMPLHHIAGLAILWRAAHDGCEVIVQDRFDPAGFAEALRDGATWASVVPTMLRRLIEAAPLGSSSRVRGVLVGGDHSSDEMIAAANAAGLPALPTYGMTETTSQVATVRPGEAQAATGTVGFPLPGVQISIDAPPGEPGTIMVEGSTVSPGFADEPPRDGPLVTSDLGYFDSAGRLVVIGRSDDIIISGGEKIVPQEVEQALSLVPGVHDAAAFGVADDEWGHCVVAVVAAPGMTARAITEAVVDRLSRHAVPKWIEVVDALPRLSNGKIDRAAVRSLAR